MKTCNPNFKTDLLADVVYALLGPETVIIPVSNSGKALQYLPDPPSLESTKEPNYRFRLLNKVIAIALGQPSDGLHALHFMGRAALDGFLADNPQCSEWPITQSPDGFTVWFRLRGFRPAATKLPTSTAAGWMGDGQMVVVYDPDSPKLYNIFQKGSAVEVEFFKFKWPPEINELFQSEIIEFRFGPPVISNLKGKPHLNLAFWSRFIASSMHLTFDPHHKSFFIYDPQAGNWTREAEFELLAKKVTQFISVYSNLTKDNRVLDFLELSRLKELISHMKITASDIIALNVAEEDEITRFLGAFPGIFSHLGGVVQCARGLF